MASGPAASHSAGRLPLMRACDQISSCLQVGAACVHAAGSNAIAVAPDIPAGQEACVLTTAGLRSHQQHIAVLMQRLSRTWSWPHCRSLAWSCFSKDPNECCVDKASDQQKLTEEATAQLLSRA